MTIKITANWVSHPETQRVMQEIARAGHRIFFVGGCVRNALMGLPVADIDLAGDAGPETVSNIAETLGFQVIPTGIDHGTVMVLAGNIPLEITTFRRDLDTDGRHATVAFTASMVEDAARRDFTMNALYADAAGEVFDPLNGLSDLQDRRVRFVGDPSARIAEDYLRILRFFRFHAVYGDPNHGIDAEGLAACAAHVEGLASLSRERVGAEMRKLLAAPDPAPTVATMVQAGILAGSLPGADPQALAPLVHLEGSTPPGWIRRLAVIGGENPEAALRLSNVEMRHYSAVRAEIETLHTPAALGFLHGLEIARDAILARAAIFGQPLPENWQQEILRGTKAQNPITASDLMPAFQGPALGERLRKLTARWLASDLKLGKSQLLR